MDPSPMEVEQFTDAQAFRAAADPLLLLDEARNNLILGVTQVVIDQPGAHDEFRGWLVHESNRVVGAAAQTPPYNLILADAENELAVRALAGAVGDPPGVVGNVPWVEIFAGEFPSVERTMAQGVFSLTEVIPPEPCPGHSRLATVDDVDLLMSWTVDFQQEAVGEIDLERMSRGVSRRIQGPPSRAAMWIHEVEGVPVSMSGNTGPTPNGIRIGPVYTPPEHRGRGYASNLVGYQSGWLLDHGYTFCFLYTDLANPTSNAIYQRLGYGQVAESAEFRFRQGSG